MTIFLWDSFLLSVSGEKQLVVHGHNASPHTAQKCRGCCAENGMPFAPHPPYSPGLARSDFFLFGYIKNHLQGISFRSHDALPAGLVAALGQIPIESLQRISEHWMERFERVSQDNSDYYPEAKDALI
jgi:histone-lysine N-methyltransferase SETMAR